MLLNIYENLIFQFIIFLDDLQGENQVFLMSLKTSMSPTA